MKKILTIFLLVFIAFQASAQLPTITVRFYNPLYDCVVQRYSVDVEFNSDVPDQQLFGMNIRFFYDDDVLEYYSMSQFETGYSLMGPPDINQGEAGSGAMFGIPGPLTWVNGSLQLTSPTPVYISSTGWTKLFRICFIVDDPDALNISSFCPSLIWDLQMNPEMGGYLPGDNGVVMTVVDPDPQQDSSPANANVWQFNWEYNNSGTPFGSPVSMYCTPTTCGTTIPLSNWALFIAIGLMLITTLFIWKRRMNV